MSLPTVVSREEWTTARKEFLAREKDLTRARDALNADRRRLPMVKIEKEYVFEGAGGKADLLDLFEGRRQLIVHHFMFDPSWDGPCRGCAGTADNIGHLAHLNGRATTLAAVSRAPFEKIAAFKDRMGWTFPWYSSYGTDFNYDFHVTLDDSVAPVEYNYRTRAEHEAAGTAAMYVESQEPFELPGLSCFLRDGDAIFHTYSAYARGLEAPGGSHYYLDLTVLGRQEDWEEPKGRAGGAAKAGDPGLRYHDEYAV